MSFALSLAADVVEAEAGATTPVGLTVTNRGPATDRYEVEIEGIDPEWRFVPVPTFAVEPGETRNEKLFFKPPRSSENKAGSYPFVVRVRSLESGEARTAQGLLNLPAFHHITMEIAPKKGMISPTTKHNDFRISLVNLGNSEHTLQLSAQDPDDRCAYEFEQDSITLGPGQGREIELIADPKQKPLLSSGRLIGFSAFARSQNERNVTATAQAQLEQRSLLSPATLVLATILGAGVFAWWTMRPKPPEIHLFLNPSHALPGDEVQVTYEARNANHVQIKMSDGQGKETIIWDGLPTGGPISVRIDEDTKGIATFTAVADSSGRQSAPDTERLFIDEPPVVPSARIVSFSANSKRVKLGTSFVVNWKVEGAKRVELAPLGIPISPEQQSQEVTPSTEGTQTITLIAYNEKGETVRKSVTVEVYDESDAQILAFAADPATAKEEEGGKTTLTWQVTGAERVELTVGSNAPIAVDPIGSKSIVVMTKTPCILTAVDAKGRKRSMTLRVLFEKTPIIIEPSTAGGTTDAGNPPDPDFPDRIPPP